MTTNTKTKTPSNEGTKEPTKTVFESVDALLASLLPKHFRETQPNAPESEGQAAGVKAIKESRDTLCLSAK